VRDWVTDHELEIRGKVQFSSEGQLLNIHEIFHEIQDNTSCHGQGPMYAGFIEVDFETSILKAKDIQRNSPISYGPFIWEGTNCSRFVRTVLLAGLSFSKTPLKLLIPPTISPTPLGIVKALPESIRVLPLSFNGKETSKWIKTI
jgi:hypothetical protein